MEPLLQLRIDGQHGCGAVGIPRVDPHGVDILDETDGDALILGIAHHFELELLPAEHRLLDEDLADETGRDAAAGHGAQFLHIVDQAAPGAAHGVGRAHDHRVAQLGRNPFGLLDGERRLAPGERNAQPIHGLLEGNAVLAPFDSVGLDADDLDAVGLQDTLAGEFGGEIQAGLAAEVGQNGVGSLLLDDLFHEFEGQGFHVGGIRHPGVGHDRRWVGVYQHNLIPKLAQGLAGLGPGIVEFARLPDDDGAGTNDHDLLDVVSPRHGMSPFQGAVMSVT